MFKPTLFRGLFPAGNKVVTKPREWWGLEFRRETDEQARYTRACASLRGHATRGKCRKFISRVSSEWIVYFTQPLVFVKIGGTRNLFCEEGNLHLRRWLTFWSHQEDYVTMFCSFIVITFPLFCFSGRRNKIFKIKSHIPLNTWKFLHIIYWTSFEVTFRMLVCSRANEVQCTFVISGEAILKLVTYNAQCCSLGNVSRDLITVWFQPLIMPKHFRKHSENRNDRRKLLNLQ